MAALDAEIAEVALHFCCHTKRGLRYPGSQRSERVIPTLQEIPRATGTNRPTNEFPASAVAFFPIGQFRLRVRDGFLRSSRCNRRMDLVKSDCRAWANVACRRENRAGVAAEFHQLPRRRQSEKSRARFRVQVPADMMIDRKRIRLNSSHR